MHWWLQFLYGIAKLSFYSSLFEEIDMLGKIQFQNKYGKYIFLQKADVDIIYENIQINKLSKYFKI